MIKRFSYGYFRQKTVQGLLRTFVHPPNELYHIPGYLSPMEGRFLYWLASKIPHDGQVVEIGSFKGKSSCFLAAGMKPLGGKLVCVDTWNNDAMPYDSKASTLAEFRENTKRYSAQIEMHHGSSTKVAAHWPTPIDLLFIDGDHSYEGCLSDIKAWVPFVRKGGWISFHDSGELGVSRAIGEHLPNWIYRYPTRAGSIFALQKLGDRN